MIVGTTTRRRTWTDDEGSGANVWPAVTDSILLLASIFIILSVSAIVLYTQRTDPQRSLLADENAGAGQKPLLATTYPIDEGFLFRPGESVVSSRTARQDIADILRQMTGDIPRIRGSASRAWREYFVVIEVAGHTDPDPFRAPGQPWHYDGNWDLSSNRADNVVHVIEEILAGDRALRGQLGFPPPGGQGAVNCTILKAAGYASHVSRAVEPERGPMTDAVKQENRRVELALYAEPAYVVRGVTRLGTEGASPSPAPGRAGPTRRQRLPK